MGSVVGTGGEDLKELHGSVISLIGNILMDLSVAGTGRV